MDTQLKKYRFGNGVLLSTEQEDEIERLSYYPVFQNATADNPVAALDFCANLECSIVVAFLREHGHYRDFSTVEERLTPRVRFSAFYAVSGAVVIMSAYRSMCVDDGWRKLCFERKPAYELLREFINERIGSENLHPLFDAIIREAAGHCGQSGHPVAGGSTGMRPTGSR